jgi:chromosome segregation ATPase
MNRSHKVVIAVLALIILALTVDHLAVRRRQERFFDLENRLKMAESEAMDALEQTKERVAHELATSTRKRVNLETDAAINEKLARYRAELQQIQEEIDSERSRLAELRDTRQRAEAGLPELIELDDLNTYYGEKLNEDESLYATIESFQTSKGTLSFDKDDLGFQYVPSTRKLARLRIGKQNSTIDPDIIKAWLADAESAKTKLGYRLISNNTKNTDDGQAKEKLFTKGDMYFTTYFQYRTVRDTNDRQSLQYDFF